MQRTQRPSGWVMVSKNRRAHNSQQLHSTSADRRRVLLGAMRTRLLNGTSCLTLSIASTIVALGVCMPGYAQAAVTCGAPDANGVVTCSSSDNGTFNLSAAQTVFDNTVNISIPASNPVPAVIGDASTAWTVTNQGILQGNARGVF